MRLAKGNLRVRVSEQPIHFSLACPPQAIKQLNRYMLITTVAEDPEGKVEITTMSSPVLTQEYPSVLHLAIKQVPEPVE